MRSKPFKLLLLTTATAIALTACGGSGAVSDKSVTAQAFASSVCSAIKQWQADIQERSGEVAALAGTDPVQGKQLLGDFIDGVITDTEAVIGKLKQAGTPDVDRGKTASDALVNAFEQVKTSLTTVRSDIDNLPTTDPVAFQQAAGALSTSISQSFDQAGTSLQEVQIPALDDAFNAAQACTDIQVGS